MPRCHNMQHHGVPAACSTSSASLHCYACRHVLQRLPEPQKCRPYGFSTETSSQFCKLCLCLQQRQGYEGRCSCSMGASTIQCCPDVKLAAAGRGACTASLPGKMSIAFPVMPDVALYSLQFASLLEVTPASYIPGPRPQGGLLASTGLLGARRYACSMWTHIQAHKFSITAMILLIQQISV